MNRTGGILFMKNKIMVSVGAVLTALCFLTAFFGETAAVYAASGQLLHRHTGSSQSGGGCYGAKKTEIRECGSYNVHNYFNGTDYTYVCGQCGHEWKHLYSLDGARCSADVTVTHYEINCGKEHATAVSFSCEKSTQEWVKELDLTASYTVHESGISVSGFLWNSSPGGASLHVTQNGTYQLGLTGSGNVDFSPTVSVTVDCIDNTPPTIESFRAESDAWRTSVELLVNASDAESGLAAEAYSYDGGASWSSAGTYEVTENGTYAVRVRDAVGNISTAETSVSTIDRTAPAISISTSPAADSWYDGSLTVTVQAQDNGCGLADAPYSFDGGASYKVGNSVILSGSGSLEIAVTDKAGNVARLSFYAEKKQRPQPTAAPGSGNHGGSAGNGAGGSGNTGSGSTGTGNGGSTGSGSTGQGGTEIGETGTGGTEPGINGSGPEDAAGDYGSGITGTDGVETGSAGSNAANENGGEGSSTGSGAAAGSGNAGSAAAGGSSGRGAGIGGISGGTGTASDNGSTGRRDRDAEGSGKSSGTGGSGAGSRNGKDGGNRRYGLYGIGSGNRQFRYEETLPQHYPGGLPRVGSMIGGHQSGDGGTLEGGSGMNADGRTPEGGSSMNADGGTPEGGSGMSAGGGAGEAGSGNAGVAESISAEEAVIQSELLASAEEREAANLQRAGGIVRAGAGGAAMLAACAVLFAAAALFGWVQLFGVRIDTRDEKGHYRFAGITRVTSKEQERLRVVPLTKQIIRNAHTNELRIRFGLLCHKRYGGETLMLRYRSMSREFKEERTVELHIRA